MTDVKIIQGDCRTALRQLDPTSVQCCVTSPPYWGLRDYGHPDQIGQENSPEEYVETMRTVFAEVGRVLKDDGTLWLNLGDTYSNSGSGPRTGGTLDQWKDGGGRYQEKLNHGRIVARNSGLPEKNLVGIPWRVAFALQAAGWFLRSDIIWAKPNCMPESVTDRPTRNHEYIFLLTKQPRYYYNAEAIKEPYSPNSIARNERGVGENHKNVNGAPGQSPHSFNQPRLHSKYTGQATKDYEAGGAQDPSETKRRVEESILNGTGANKRTVWHVGSTPFKGAHFATFPPDLIKPCILAGSRAGDTILDPFGGSGTTGLVATELGRSAVLVELNPEYAALCGHRTNVTPGLAL